MNKTDSNRKRLFLIDGYAALYRSHFAMIRNPLITSTGLHTSALFGFTNQVFRLIRQEQPDYIAAVFDSKEKTFRHEKYPEYKATREKMPDELVEQLPYLWDLLNAMQIFTLSQPGFEADDIIGTLVKLGKAADLDVYIVSGDKDFMQLVDDQVFLYAPGGRNRDDIIYDSDAVLEKWGVPPEKIIDFLGLMGDSSDNIPGVRGVGEKSAQKLIQDYGSLTAALDNAEKISNKRVRNGLLENREEALLSRELVTIVTDMDLDCSIDDLKRNEFDKGTLVEMFTNLEFRGLANQLEDFKSDSIEKTAKPDKDYQIVKTLEQLTGFIKGLDNSQLLSFDLETTSVEPMEAEIIGFSFSQADNSGWYIPVDYLEKDSSLFGSDDLETVLTHLKPVLENKNISKTGQNVKYDCLILKRHGIKVKGLVFDTMIAAHLINSASRSLKLDNLAMEYLNYEMVPIEDLIGKGRNQISMREVELEKCAFYAAEDADIAFQLTGIFKSKLEEMELLDFFNKVELPLIDVLIDMEYDGTYLDRAQLETMSNELGKKIESLSSEIIRLADREFNINSTQQLAQILFDDLNLPQIKKRSTAEDVLEQLRDQHELPGLILDYRKLNKLKNTYLDPLQDYINPDTTRVHSSFNQTIAATGRLSSSNPNFQNIPIRTEVGREIRKAFKAQEKDWKILSADYSQIELRIMAHLSKDPGLVEAFNKGEDIHARTASTVYGVPLEDVLPEMRRTAKVVNFGIMYGAGPFRMSQELGIPRREAMVIIENYFQQYGGIRSYIEETMNMARNEKYVRTIMGRKRPVWDADSDNALRRDAAERMAINMPIQGTAAEMIKIAMIAIHKKLSDSGNKFGGARMILQIHDELIFESPQDTIQDLREMVVVEMGKALPLSVPVIVDWGIGDSWFEAH